MTLPDIKMYHVRSSMIDAAGFDLSENMPGMGDLYVRMKNGNTYKYETVPQMRFHELLEANSKGQYFLYEIKDKFKEAKIEAP